jgi:hypothetical protein
MKSVRGRNIPPLLASIVLLQGKQETKAIRLK